jgi:hypothetical protein
MLFGSELEYVEQAQEEHDGAPPDGGVEVAEDGLLFRWRWEKGHIDPGLLVARATQRKTAVRSTVIHLYTDFS